MLLGREDKYIYKKSTYWCCTKKYVEGKLTTTKQQQFLNVLLTRGGELYNPVTKKKVLKSL